MTRRLLLLLLLLLLSAAIELLGQPRDDVLPKTLLTTSTTARPTSV